MNDTNNIMIGNEHWTRRVTAQNTEGIILERQSVTKWTLKCFYDLMPIPLSFRQCIFLVTIACLVGPQAARMQAQSGFRNISVSRLGFAAPGYFLIAPDAYDSLGFVDHSGVRTRRNHSGVISTLQDFGDSVLTHFVAVGSSTQFVRRDRNLVITDTLTLSGGYPVDFHEGKMWTDSSYIILGHDDRTMDLSKSVVGGRIDAVVRGAVIQERTLSGTLLFEWKSLDHIPVTDATEDIDLTQARIDYIHVNSINRDQNGDLIISCRHLDEIICVRRTDGDVLWRFGGKKSRGNEFTYTNDITPGFTGFSHQHTAFITSRGTLMMFDNGNLKAEPRASRAVEYSLNVVARTATRVWEYVPSPRVFSASMGSVEELENGNVLLGFGMITQPASSPLVAQEVNRQGAVVAELADNSGTPLASYRVLKTAMGMCADYVSVNVKDTNSIEFTSGDSTTHISMLLHRVTKPTGIIVERHSYAPKIITFVGAPHCGTLPMRWVVRIEDTSLVRGQMTFDIGAMSQVESPEQIRLLYRPVEGQAGFAPLEGAYDSQKRAIVLPALLAGEFMLAYKDCFDPTPVSPLNAAVEVSTSPKLTWKVAALADAYEVEWATNPGFSQSRMLITRRVDTTLSGLANAQTYYWRVRKRWVSSVGPWSVVFSFTTQIGQSTPIAPVIAGKDTVAVLPNQLFRWTKAQGAMAYRFTVSDVETEQPAVDVTTAAESFNIGTRLLPNTRYFWTVRGVNGTTLGRASSRAFFITAPDRPELRLPEDDAMVPYATSTQFSWSSVPGALRYALLVRRANDSSVLYRDTLIYSTTVRVNMLPKNVPMIWECRAIGRYGAGLASASRHLTLMFDPPLDRPRALEPRGNEFAFGDVAIEFSWTPVNSASGYRMQVYDRRTSDDAMIDTILQGAALSLSGFQPATSYDWRVMAYNDRVASQWSDTARFITAKQELNTGLLPQEPPTDAEEIPISGVCRYSTSELYSSYVIDFSRDPDFDSIDLTVTSDAGSVFYSGLRERTRYFWHVIGIDADGNRQTGPQSSFITVRPTVNVDDVTIRSLISVVASKTSIIVSGSVPAGAHCEVFDVLGRRLATESLNAGSYHEIDKPLSEGVVVVVITTPQDVPLWKGAILLIK